MADSRAQRTAFTGQGVPASVLIASSVYVAAGGPRQGHGDAEQASWPTPRSFFRSKLDLRALVFLLS